MTDPTPQPQPQVPGRPPRVPGIHPVLHGAAAQMPGTVDPADLPDGHPLKALAVKLGTPTLEGAPQPQAAPPVPSQGNERAQARARALEIQSLKERAAAQGIYSPQNVPQAGSQVPQMAPQFARMDPAAARAADPLSRPYTLPSGGLLYPNHSGQVLILPMRGEQQEVLAGAGSGVNASPAIRNVISQCVQCNGVAYEDLTMGDWSALLLHILAYSLGTDMIPLFPTCEVCGQQFDGSRPLSQVPCRVLRRASPGEPVTWPPVEGMDESEELKILREMGLDQDSDGKPTSAQQVYAASHIEETTEVELSNGQRIGWRYLRLRDLAQAEDYAERAAASGAQAKSPGSLLHSFITARSIATVDGQRVGVFQAMQWVKAAPLFLSKEIEESTERRAFGYELSPTFRCPAGHRFRQQLPLNAAMFRRSRSIAAG